MILVSASRYDQDRPTQVRRGLCHAAMPARRPRRRSAEERAIEARRLDALGFSNAKIARTIGVSKATVVNYLRGYPYRRTRK